MKGSSMQIMKFSLPQEAVEKTAWIIFEQLKDKPNSVIGLATGRTMEPVYQSLVELIQGSDLDLSHARFFMLDEYYGLPEGHASSFKTYITKHFMTPLNLSPATIFFPPANHNAGPDLYEKMIKNNGGIDLQLLGIGQNGHVGFNEPGTLKESRTRIVELSSHTRLANQDQFEDRIVPMKALTIGVSTILEAKKLIMLALGESKAAAINTLMSFNDLPDCPATYLKNHSNFLLVLDEKAGFKSLLK
jgi:glucosamine-6-phosphate deaminase